MLSIVNLNEYVWVEINKHGWEVIEEFYKKLYTLPGIDNDVERHARESMAIHKNYTRPHDIDGKKIELTMMQLHEFMNLFGEKMYCGADQVIVDNKLYFNVD